MRIEWQEAVCDVREATEEMEGWVVALRDLPAGAGLKLPSNGFG
jgi:hypothetical protein